MVEVTKLSNKTVQEAQDFYRSVEWKTCRKEFLETVNHECVYCKKDLREDNRKELNVDHIKPLRFFWDLRIDKNNLQVTCKECNATKLNRIDPKTGKHKTAASLHSTREKYWRNPNYYKWLNKRKV